MFINIEAKKKIILIFSVKFGETVVKSVSCVIYRICKLELCESEQYKAIAFITAHVLQ